MDDVVVDAERRTGERLLRYFKHEHLRQPLRQTAEQFAALAVYICNTTKAGPERTICLRKILEGKDAGVRAALEE